MSQQRKWFRKKRNIARLSTLGIWIIGSIAVLVMYRLEERSVLWTQLSLSSAALMLYSLVVPRLVDSVKATVKATVNTFVNASKVIIYALGLVFGVMLIYISMMVGAVILDIVHGPVTEVVTIEERWGQARGGDKVRTSEGDTYEVISERVGMREGRAYKVMILTYSRLILGIGIVAH